MSGLALPDDVALLDAVDDPGEFVVQALDRAKAWLNQATITDLPEVVENKRRAETIRCYVAQKELGKDSELAAAEIVRRAERRIGVLIREGQEAGEITGRGDETSGWRGRNLESQQVTLKKASPTDFASHGELSGVRGGIYAMTDDVSEEQFEEAVTEAREEKNMSRANVVRKAKAKKDGAESKLLERNRAHRVEQIRGLSGTGRTSHQIAEQIGVKATYVRDLAREEGIPLPDSMMRGIRRHDSNRIARETVSTLDGTAMSVGLIDFETLDATEIEGWISSLSTSLPVLTRFHKQLKEKIRDQQ